MLMSLQALMWGTIAGSALLLGAAAAWWLEIPRKIVSSIMAFGAGVLISALAFELVAEAEKAGGLWATVIGFLAGAVSYVGANALLVRLGAEHRRRSKAALRPGSRDGGASNGGTAIAVGALLDGIPESIVLGVGLLTGAAVNPTMLAAIFISNVPEGLASTADMKRAGKGAKEVFAIWGSIAVLSGLAAMVGYLALDNAPGEVIAVVTAIAAGGILAMLADTMIPEAFEEQHMLTGLIAALGFLAALILHFSA
jgi:ZIP family zinc transporter